MTEPQNEITNEEYINGLKEEISYLKEILASKLFEEDHLINFTCREIETDYAYFYIGNLFGKLFGT